MGGDLKTECAGLGVVLLLYGVSFMASSVPPVETAVVDSVVTADYGKTLSYPDVETKLRELQPGIHFDMGPRLGMEHPFMSERAGVYYDGRHICAIDRGVIPEFKVWTTEIGHVDVPMNEVHKYSDAVISFVQVLPTDERFHELWEIAEKGDARYIIDNGKLFDHRAIRVGKKRGRILRVGWRHTFERLVAAKIPGVTRQSIGAKFGVDMYKMPIGSPEEIRAAIVEE